MRRRFLGFDEDWRDDGTGTRGFFILWCCVWQTTFHHSTTWLGW